MGCCYSTIEREETVSRCKARKRYVKQLVKARQAFAAAHAMYIRSLRTTGSALLQFAELESNLYLHPRHRHQQHPPPFPPSPPRQQLAPAPPPPPPMSQSSDAWTSSSGTASSQALSTPPPPPPPPPPEPSSWDFWDPFVPSSAATRSATEEEWESTTTTTASEAPAPATAAAASVAAPPSVLSGFSKDVSGELAMVVSRNSKDLIEIIKELDDYFLRAADAGGVVSSLLEVPSSGFASHSASDFHTLFL